MKPLKQACFTLNIEKENLKAYINSHDIWPEMLAAMSQAGIKDYSLFFREDGLIVGFFKSEDPQASLAKLGRTEVNARWQKHMAQFFGGAEPDMESDQLKWLSQYFYLE